MQRINHFLCFFITDYGGLYGNLLYRESTGTTQELTETSEGTADYYDDITLTLLVDNSSEGSILIIFFLE
ncbi:MAG: hypothetical protein ABDH37_08010 [Candidatus Hydrothermales bacterium]